MRPIKFAIYLLALAILCPAQNYDDADSDTYQYGGAKLTPLEREGRNTWYFWTGGGEKFWRQVAGITHGITDLLQYVDSR